MGGKNFYSRFILIKGFAIFYTPLTMIGVKVLPAVSISEPFSVSVSNVTNTL